MKEVNVFHERGSQGATLCLLAYIYFAGAASSFFRRARESSNSIVSDVLALACGLTQLSEWVLLVDSAPLPPRCSA
jgi:hypothetical protein